VNPFWTILLAIIGCITGTISLIFSFRKDAHHIRLEVTYREHGVVVLGINNDSAVPFGILSIGYFRPNREITWITKVGNYATNKYVGYPIAVASRSLFLISLITSRDVPSRRELYGYCVQLETGRLYVIKNSAPFLPTTLLHITSLISRISRGSWVPGVSAPRIPLRPDQ
jgi:hypothetical protein